MNRTNPLMEQKKHEAGVVRGLLAALPEHWTQAILEIDFTWGERGRLSTKFKILSPEGNSGVTEPPAAFHESAAALAVGLFTRQQKQLKRATFRLHKQPDQHWETQTRYLFS